MNKHSLWGLLIVTIAGCGGGGAQPETPASEAAAPAPGAEAHEAAEAAEAAPKNFAEQVAWGQKEYGEHCADCHGASGEGTPGPDGAPAVVGLDKGALPLDPPADRKYRKTRFETVADIADFVVHNMPPKKAGTLPEEEYWAILAFDLKANGIDLGDKKLDAALAPALKVPRK